LLLCSCVLWGKRPGIHNRDKQGDL